MNFIPRKTEIIEFCNEIADEQLTLDEIKLKILHGTYSLDEIENCISESNLNIEVLEVIKRYLYFNVRLEFYDFRNLPPLLQDRTDIYVLGNQNSGKSTFLASLFSYVDRMGLLYENTYSLAGTIYLNNLQTGYDFGFFPPEGFSGVNYICCDLEKPEDINKVHPLNIIEFNYQKINLDTHVNNCFDQNSEAKSFLKSDNSKVLLFFIEYSQNQEKIDDNSQNLIRLLQRLKEFGILVRTTNINIVITKCDLFPAHEDPMEFAITFINQNYLSFITGCKSISTYYNRDLKIKVFPFSVGELSLNSTYIKTRNNLWPKMIVDEIFSTTFYRKRTTSFFSRFFK